MAMTSSPAGVQTPSTYRSNRLRRPLDSPFPSPAAAGASSGTEHSAAALSDHHLREIETVFRIFDPSLSGIIDLPTFEVMVRSLGFRMTRVELAGAVESLWEERRHLQRQQRGDNYSGDEDCEATAEERRQIDLDTAVRILSEKGYAARDEEDEVRTYFRLFDGGNKGYVTVEDLRRVQEEVKQAERELDIGQGSTDLGAVGDATLRAMIKQFDENGDGVLDYEEFKTVLEPALSLPAKAPSP